MKYVFHCLLLLLSSQLVFGQQSVTFTDALKKVPDLTLQGRFVAANQITAKALQEDPQNAAAHYLQLASECMELFLHAEEEDFNRELARLEEGIARLEKLPETEAWRNVMVGELRVALAVLHAKFQQTLKGGWQFYQAYGLLSANQKRFPDFIPNNMVMGVLQATVGSLPEDYRNIASLFGLKGDLESAMRMLNKAYWRITADEEYNFLRQYYGFVYSFVSFQLYERTDVTPETLHLPNRNAGFLVYLQALIEAEQGKVQEAIKTLQSRKTFTGERPFYYLHYMIGKYAVARDPGLAKREFEVFLRRPQNNPYKKSTLRFLAWIAIMEGQQQKAEQYRIRVLQEGSTNLGADRQALKEAKAGFNPTLIVARANFDGGLYQEAIAALERSSPERCCPSPDEKVEWYYRYGRALQGLNKKEQALVYFQKAVGVKEAAASFAKGNSYLQIGKIHQEAKRNSAARKAYSNCLRQSGFPFSEGLHQKAKAALKEVE